ncbi:dephospho-CoA kinase [Larsenimonas salina]|uniref:dephospho-CoA kinase n=1 Tax=Larsenimonas salina TaxID=1295565 RepID=UPI00255C7A05|nr:dephospho-CoA kinase [Larsenimonas salina]
MTITIGLTGGIGSGKSTVAILFEALGVPWIDADQVARDIVLPGEPALEEISERFGADILAADGTLNRRALRNVVFDDDQRRAELEAITHPRIRKRLKTFLETPKASPYQLLVSPLLLETTQKALVQRILVVDTPEPLQIARTTQRDSVDDAHVRRILEAQMPRTQRLAAADDVIDNQGDPDALRAQVNDLHATYLTLCGATS